MGKKNNSPEQIAAEEAAAKARDEALNDGKTEEEADAIAEEAKNAFLVQAEADAKAKAEAEEAEKEAAKAAKAAEKAAAAEAAKAASQIMADAWKSIGNEVVFVQEPRTEKARSTANKFAAEPKVRTVIFPTPDDADNQLYWGGINGFFFAVVLGVDVELPQSIADHIRNSRLANARASSRLIVQNPFTGQQVQVNLESAPEETKRRLRINA